MPDLSDQLRIELPYLRRYARALTGTQETGDDLAFATLQAILEDRNALETGLTVRVAIFKLFHTKWQGTDPGAGHADAGLHHDAQIRLSQLTPDSREALLLSTIEEFTPAQVGRILGIATEAVASLLQKARLEMQKANSGTILIIEDEPIIAADLTRIVEAAGHQVTGVGRTRAEAVALGKQSQPDLILADIQLADGSSGIDATHELLAEFGGIPIIFVTAFPERLLTGTRPEPAFLISKPYNDNHVISAVSQAMFFATTEVLKDG